MTSIPMTAWRRIILTAAACAAGVLPLLTAGCDKPSSSSSSSTGGAAGAGGAGGGDTILVGSFLSLTGSTATFGTTTRAGIELAVEQQNAAGGVLGKKVVVNFMDNQGKAQETGNAVTRLITSDKVIALLGDVASTQSLAAAPIAQQYGVPMISPSSTNPQVTQIGDMIFRVCIIDPDQGYAVAKFAYDKGCRKVAVLFDQKQAYSTGLKDNFADAFTKLGGTVTEKQPYSSGDADFSAQLTTIKGTQPDAIFVPGYYTEAGTIAVQARRLGITVPLMGGDGWESPKLAEIGGQSIEGCFFSNHYAPGDDWPQSKAFVDAYEKKHGEKPEALAALGFDSAMVLFDAIKRAGTTEGKALAKAIAETKELACVTGSITIDQNRNARKPIVILEMKKGKAVYVTTINPPQ